MKIIKKGDISKTVRIYRFNCQKCGCVFKCNGNEVKNEMDSYNDMLISYNCPTCGNKVVAA
jgi:transcription elongation factor Elf1